METCTAEFARLASEAGGIKCDGSAFVTFTNPFGLHHWTMPLIEATLLAGSVACLIHALWWGRTHHDSSNLVMWGAGILALLLIEPIAYFPQWFGLEEKMGLTFVHNQFSVQFLYNRLPLYIVAMYPVFGYLSYVLVQRTGVFERQRASVGAVCVAFVFHSLYEVIEFVGPQLRWWIWNYDIPTGQPTLGATPYVNIQAFCIGIPLGMALATRWIATKPDQSGGRTAANIVLVSLATWPVMFLTGVPSFVLALAGLSTETARLIGTWLLVVFCAAVTPCAFVDAYRARVRGDVDLPAGIGEDRFALISVAIYLVVAMVTWIAAFPDFLKARDGLTPGGDPIGSLPYGIFALVASVALLVGAYAGSGSRVAAPAAQNVDVAVAR
jgi:hypothetical protein